MLFRRKPGLRGVALSSNSGATCRMKTTRQSARPVWRIFITRELRAFRDPWYRPGTTAAPSVRFAAIFSSMRRGNPPKWQLREWIVINSGAPTPASFTPVTAKENPLAEFYSDTIGPETSDVALETSERTEFQTQFKNTFLKRMIEPDVLRQFLTAGQAGYVAVSHPKSATFDLGKYKIDILNRIGARFDNRFNEFQSVAQGNEDDPKTIADASGPVFKGGASNALNAFAIDPAQKPTIDDVLNRAGAIKLRRMPPIHRQPTGRFGEQSTYPVASKCGFRARD